MRTVRVTGTLAMACAGIILFSACTITQRAMPVIGVTIESTPICVVEKLDVREDFSSALDVALRKRGFLTTIVPPGFSDEKCPLLITYDAKYSWDLTLYMAWAKLSAFKDGARAGEALYSAPRAGFALTTRIYESTQSKVDTMVNQLFPY